MKLLISGGLLASLFCFAASASSPVIVPLITEPYSKQAEEVSDALRCFNWSVKEEATEASGDEVFYRDKLVAMTREMSPKDVVSGIQLYFIAENPPPGAWLEDEKQSCKNAAKPEVQDRR